MYACTRQSFLWLGIQALPHRPSPYSSVDSHLQLMLHHAVEVSISGYMLVCMCSCWQTVFLLMRECTWSSPIRLHLVVRWGSKSHHINPGVTHVKYDIINEKRGQGGLLCLVLCGPFIANDALVTQEHGESIHDINQSQQLLSPKGLQHMS